MNQKPLAYRMRPKKIEDIVGQDHIIGEHTSLYQMIQNGFLPSMILYGPPGTGKTSMAKAIAGSLDKDFFEINATISVKKDVDSVVSEAIKSGNAIILIDEIHALNVRLQDTLLNSLEEGSFTLIGATTENPFHRVNNAIRSRCGQIKQLNSLSPDDVLKVLRRALEDDEEGLGQHSIDVDEEGLKLLSGSTGDARSALSILEEAFWSSKNKDDDKVVITKEKIKECIGSKGFTHDNKGDVFYNLLSAYQKSIRGSDVDASLYYLARLLEGGDLEAVIRRTLITYFEDISMAIDSGSNDLSSEILSAIETIRITGLPEARIPLANIVVKMCLAPKSNSAYKALDRAIQDVRNSKAFDIPKHIQDSHYAGSKELGVGGYLYPHDYPNHWVRQSYLPEEIKHKTYYSPSNSGGEERLGRIYKRLQDLQSGNA